MSYWMKGVSGNLESGFIWRLSPHCSLFSYIESIKLVDLLQPIP